MNVAYYPGCSLESSSEAYDLSTRQVCKRLGIGLVEIDDWNCCGATESMSVDLLGAHALVARNLALVPDDLEQIIAPCAACFLNLRKTNTVLQEQEELGSKVAEALDAGGLSYEPGRLRVRHLLDVICDDIGQTRIRAHLAQPLAGLRVAPYYGCQIVRPRLEGHDPEHPRKLDDLLRWLGATVVDYPLRTHCCGGHMTQISEDMAYELIRRLLHNAAEYDADVIACLCPMCQMNLDVYQGRVNNAFNTQYRLPALFFTQLIGLAIGLEPDDLGFGKEIVKGLDGIRKKVLGDSAPPTAKPRGRPDPRELPMPGREDD